MSGPSLYALGLVLLVGTGLHVYRRGRDRPDVEEPALWLPIQHFFRYRLTLILALALIFAGAILASMRR